MSVSVQIVEESQQLTSDWWLRQLRNEIVHHYNSSFVIWLWFLWTGAPQHHSPVKEKTHPARTEKDWLDLKHHGEKKLPSASNLHSAKPLSSYTVASTVSTLAGTWQVHMGGKHCTLCDATTETGMKQVTSCFKWHKWQNLYLNQNLLYLLVGLGMASLSFRSEKEQGLTG